MFSRFLQRNLSRGSVLSSHNVTGTTSKARTVVTLTPSSRMVGSSSSLMCRGRSMTSPFVATGSVLPQNLHQQQQERYNWTKAKKKRYARHERRAKLAQQGIELPHPPYYTPVDEVTVVNAVDRQAQREAAAEKDAQVSAELQERMERQKNQPPVLRYHMTGLQMSDRVRRLFDLANGNQREVVQAQKQQGMELFQLREGDTGSTPVQIIALTTRIQQLQTHMAKHKKDKHSKRGMDALFVRRRKLLNYLERKDFDAYRKVVKTLGLTR